MDEGYIKFQPVWTRSKALPAEYIYELNQYRQQLFNQNLIGVYSNGIGYGNISRRYQRDTNQFVISGSATGSLPRLTPNHFSLVTSVQIDKNQLHCTGPIVASSESMSHAVIYQSLPWVQVVLHVHDLEMWQKWLHRIPTTDRSAAYGTPEMAYSIIDLIQQTDLPQQKKFVMEGHEEGIFVFGKTFEEAMRVLLG